jgi:hypothetical protein
VLFVLLVHTATIFATEDSTYIKTNTSFRLLLFRVFCTSLSMPVRKILQSDGIEQAVTGPFHLHPDFSSCTFAALGTESRLINTRYRCG